MNIRVEHLISEEGLVNGYHQTKIEYFVCSDFLDFNNLDPACPILLPRDPVLTPTWITFSFAKI